VGLIRDLCIDLIVVQCSDLLYTAGEAKMKSVSPMRLSRYYRLTMTLKTAEAGPAVDLHLGTRGLRYILGNDEAGPVIVCKHYWKPDVLYHSLSENG
jgi:hypothetical protein